jgi:hypothetical protein
VPSTTRNRIASPVLGAVEDQFATGRDGAHATASTIFSAALTRNSPEMFRKQGIAEGGEGCSLGLVGFLAPSSGSKAGNPSTAMLVGNIEIK